MKQTIEIEVPEGKKAIFENNQITFVDEEPYWKSINSFDYAYFYCLHRRNKFIKYLNSYHQSKTGTYEEKVAQLRLIIAALTNNEKLSLTNNKLYYPVIQFCNAHDINECFGNKIIGKIKSEGKEYVVVGGVASIASFAGLGGLGYVSSNYRVSGASAYLGLFCVSSKEIAKHLSIYFGKLIFEITYERGDWEWVE